MVVLSLLVVVVGETKGDGGEGRGGSGRSNCSSGEEQRAGGDRGIHSKMTDYVFFALVLVYSFYFFYFLAGASNSMFFFGVTSEAF